MICNHLSQKILLMLLLEFLMVPKKLKIGSVKWHQWVKISVRCQLTHSPFGSDLCRVWLLNKAAKICGFWEFNFFLYFILLLYIANFLVPTPSVFWSILVLGVDILHLNYMQGLGSGFPRNEFNLCFILRLVFSWRTTTLLENFFDNYNFTLGLFSENRK